MKLAFPNQVSAQGRATSLHNAIRAGNAAYDASCNAGQTLRWSIPFQDLDNQGVPIGTNWYITCRDRCLPHLTGPELAALVSEGTVSP